MTSCKQCHLDGGHKLSCTDESNQVRKDRLTLHMSLTEPIVENGCECPCDHHPDERGDECEVCLACRIGEAVGK